MLWLLPGGLILGIRQLRVEDESVAGFSSYALLSYIVHSIPIYQSIGAAYHFNLCAFFRPGFPVAASWELPLRIGYPLFTFAIGIFAAERLRRKRPSTSTLLYFFTVCMIDQPPLLLAFMVWPF